MAAGDTLDGNITVTYLSGYTIHKDSADLGWPFGGITFAARPAGAVVLEVTGGQDSYDLSKLEQQAVYQVKLWYDGQAVTGGDLDRTELKGNLLGGNAKWETKRTGDGALETNPLRMDIEEAGRICGIDFIVNVVLSEHKEIIKAVAGHPVAAHRAGCRFLDRIYLKLLPRAADIVLVSQGGAPKDLNLYQTQKALDNARHAVKQGGIIILIGSCREGMGERVFEEWMTKSESPEAMIQRIGRDFQLGGHKAAAIAMTLQKAKIDLVSEMEDDFVRSIFLTPQPDVQTALDRAFEELGPDASVLAMPYGGSTLPKIMG